MKRSFFEPSHAKGEQDAAGANVKQESSFHQEWQRYD